MKLTRSVRLSAFCLLLLLSAALAQARPVCIWQQAELLQKADLVVIATAHSTADDRSFNSKSVRPGLGTWIPVETEFDVQAVVKGQFSGKMLTVNHYRYLQEDRVLIVDGPAFVEFDPKKKQYLIYLKKRGDHYEPLTGQYDPNQSFYQIQSYHG